MKIFNKLVRDKIPEKIEENGEVCKIKILSDEDYKIELNKKLQEEINEYFQADNENKLEELADVQEVLNAIVLANGYSQEDLENVRMKKFQKRGGFEKKIFLESTDLNEE